MTKNNTRLLADWCNRVNAGENIDQIVGEIGKECDRLKDLRKTIGPQTLYMIAIYSTLTGMIVMHEACVEAQKVNPNWKFVFDPELFLV